MPWESERVGDPPAHACAVAEPLEPRIVLSLGTSVLTGGSVASINLSANGASSNAGVGGVNGGNGGTIIVRAGVHVSTGDGSLGSLHGPAELQPGKTYQYTQITPATYGGPVPVLTVTGDVTIDTLDLFWGSVVVDWSRVTAPPHITLNIGQAIWLDPGTLPSNPALGPDDSQALLFTHFINVNASANPAQNAAILSGGVIELNTTERGRMSVIAMAYGGSGSAGGVGGKGGGVSVQAQPGVVASLDEVVDGGSGGPGGSVHPAGSKGGDGGTAAFAADKAVTHGLSASANGGAGGPAWQVFPTSATGPAPGGTGGNAGAISFKANGSDTGVPLAYGVIDAVGGIGGRGGIGNGGMDGSSGTGGRGGVGGAGGAVGLVSLSPAGSSLFMTVNGGAGGPGGTGGIGGSAASLATGTGGTGGPGGPGGTGALPGGTGGNGGSGGSGGNGKTLGNTGATGTKGSTAALPTRAIAPSLPTVIRDDWTLMVYLAGDATDMGFAVLKTLRNFEATDLRDKPVNIVAFLDRTTGADDSGSGRTLIPSDEPWGGWSDTRVGFVSARTYAALAGLQSFLGIPVITSVFVPLPKVPPAMPPQTERNSASPSAMAEFIAAATKAAPAQHYALITNGHGGGWSGLNTDFFPGPDGGAGAMSLAGLNTAIAGAAPQFKADNPAADGKLDLLVLGNCTMAMMETAYAVRSSVRYLVATQDDQQIMPAGFLDTLQSNPSTDPKTFATAIIDYWGSFLLPNAISDNGFSLRYLYRTASAVDESAVAALATALNGFAGAAMASTGAATAAAKAAIPPASFLFVENRDKDLRKYLSDVMGFAAADPALTALRAAAQTAITALDTAVIRVGDSNRADGSGGLSVYMPVPGETYDPGYAKTEFGGPTNRWSDLVNKLLQTSTVPAPEYYQNIVPDPGNTPATATPLPTPTATPKPLLLSAGLSSGTDLDYYSFSAAAGDKLYLELTDAGATADTQPMTVTLTKSGSTTVLATVTGGVSGTATLAGTTLATPGTYLLKVSTTAALLPSSPYDLHLAYGAAARVNPAIVAPATAALGTVPVNLASHAAVVIKNSGVADLLITAVTVMGTTAVAPALQAFSLPLRIPAGQSFKLPLTVTPTVAGALTGKLRITCNDPAKPTVTVTLTATAAAATAAVSGNGVAIANGATAASTAAGTDFGSTPTAGGTVTRTFTLKNTGVASLVFLGTPLVRIGGTNAGDFVVVRSPPAVIAAGASATFQVRFDPKAAGLRKATITLPVNGAAGLAFTFAITGTGVGNPSTLSGTVFADTNANRMQDGAEAGVAGWQVYIDSNANGKFDTGEQSALTAAGGVWSILDASPGTLRVRVVLLTGWLFTSPAAGYASVTLAPGQTVAGVKLGVHKT